MSFMQQPCYSPLAAEEAVDEVVVAAKLRTLLEKHWKWRCLSQGKENATD